jgi:hypothetical protein
MKCWIEHSKFNDAIYLCKKNIFGRVKEENITHQAYLCVAESAKWMASNNKFAAISSCDSWDMLIVANKRIWKRLIKQYDKFYNKKKTLNTN